MTPQKLTSSRGVHPRRRRALKRGKRTMRILAIETSCDETAAAIVENGTKIISNVIASSMQMHEKTGGIIPEIAAREQVRCIIPVINEVLQKLDNNNKQTTNLLSGIDALAVTVGPGLNGSLLVGVETAKTIAFVSNKPIIPVNHILAHIYANWLLPKSLITNYQPPTFPIIALVVSGGHTELFLMESHEDIKWLGGTLDDAAGEAFDKTARLLNLGFPGGPVIATEAEKFSNRHPEFISGSNQMLKRVQHDIEKLPRPMIHSDDLNFSFSGLKTAVLREVNNLKSLNKLNNEMIGALAYEIQESITDVLVKKTLSAATKYKVKSILLGGGVAANQRLKEKFIFSLHSQPTTHNPQLFIPPPTLCTDNAAYIGSSAYFHNHPISWRDINSKPDLIVEV